MNPFVVIIIHCGHCKVIYLSECHSARSIIMFVCNEAWFHTLLIALNLVCESRGDGLVKHSACLRMTLQQLEYGENPANWNVLVQLVVVVVRKLLVYHDKYVITWQVCFHKRIHNIIRPYDKVVD